MGPTNHIIQTSDNICASVPASCEVQATTLDHWDLGVPIMIKIDVEGFETEVVSGGRRAFEASDLRYVLIELAVMDSKTASGRTPFVSA
jgi:FkbM family methyltransferase